MKNLFLKLVPIALSVSLITSCSSNTQSENTALGVASGAVLGGLGGALVQGSGHGAAIVAGAIVGGVIGGVVGHSMDSSDNARMNTAMDTTKTHRTTYWKNETTGTTYRVTPTSSRMSYHGHPDCRTYHASAMISGKKQVTTGTACRQSDGTWKTVN